MKKIVIQSPEQMDLPLHCNPINAEWKMGIQGQYWFSGHTVDDVQPQWQKNMLMLREHLLLFGGEEAAMPGYDSDWETILTRHQIHARRKQPMS